MVDQGKEETKTAASARGGVTGVVLAGGRSSRLGHDKAHVRLSGSGEEDLLARSVALLEDVCGKALVVGRIHPAYACVPDLLPEHGPVGGITTALQATGSACMVLSCDLPFMERAVLERLLLFRDEQSGEALVTSYRRRDTEHIEALVSVYEAGALPYFQDCFAKKLLKIRLVVPAHLQRYLYYAADESLPFFNINYPADLERARRIMQRLPGSGG